MLDLDLCQEFIVLSRYMNFSKASESLFVSQPTLSKHIEKLEGSLGFKLIAKKGNRLALTEAGSIFLGGIQPILEECNALTDRCRLAHTQGLNEIVVRDPPFDYDIASETYQCFLEDVRTALPSSNITFVHENHKDLRAFTKAGEMDILIEYHCRPKETILGLYEEANLFAVKISEDPLVIWTRNSIFEGQDWVSPDVLREYPVTIPSDISDPQNELVTDLAGLLGFTPRLYISPATSAVQFFRDPRPNCLFLLPESYARGSSFAVRKDMHIAELKNPAITYSAYIVTSQANPHFDTLKPVMLNHELANSTLISP